MPSRRRVLGTVAVGLCGALAGCTDPAGVLQMDSATTETVVVETTSGVRSGPEADPDVTALLERARENGSATIEAKRQPLAVHRPVAFEGRLYDAEVTEVGERTRTEYDVQLDFDPEDASGTEVAFDDLPAVDRRVLEPLIEGFGRESGGDEGIDVGTRYHYADDELEASALVPEREVEIVLVNGDPVRVRTEPVETTVTEFRYDLTERAESLESYVEDLRAEYQFELTDLSDDERDVVEEAIDEGGYYASSTDDDAYEGVARAFLAHDPVQADGGQGEWLVEYEGTAYWGMLDLLQFDDLRDELEEAP